MHVRQAETEATPQANNGSHQGDAVSAASNRGLQRSALGQDNERVLRFMLVVDEHTRFAWVYFHKSVSECPGHLSNFLSKIGRHGTASTGHVQHVQFIRSDGGADFSSFAFDQVLDKHNIQHECVPADSSEQNGIVKRKIGVIGERVRTILN